MSALGKEDSLLEIDSQPFLASSYDDAMKLYMASKPEIVKGLDSKGLVFLYAVPWPAGHGTAYKKTKPFESKPLTISGFDAIYSFIASSYDEAKKG